MIVTLLKAMIGLVFGAFIALKVGTALLAGSGLDKVYLAAVGVLGVAVLLAMYRAFGMVGERLLTELRHGYVTSDDDRGPVVAAKFWVGQNVLGTGIRPTPWDFRGTWILGRQGDVIRTPDHDRFPPGLYPSLNHPGKWEVWTGSEWSNNLRPAPRRA